MILVYLEPRIPGPWTPGRSGGAPPPAPRGLTHPGQPGPSDVCSARASNSNRPPARGRVTRPEPFATGGWGRRSGRPRSSPKPLREAARASLRTRVRVRALPASRGCGSGGSAAAARVVRPRRLRPFPFPGAGARMAAGTRPAAGPRSRTAMAQWRKKKGLRKRRGAASQARSSDSEDGEFEIQAEDDTRAQKVGAWCWDAR